MSNSIASNITTQRKHIGQNLWATLTLHPQYGELMTTKQLAEVYGVSPATIRSHMLDHADEVREGHHFYRVGKINAVKSLIKPHFWTPEGWLRMGFYIKSERAKLVRDWAEMVCVDQLRSAPQGPTAPHSALQAPLAESGILPAETGRAATAIMEELVATAGRDDLPAIARQALAESLRRIYLAL